ncbi:MAG: acyltransferase [Xanthomonadales bacterium]|nr:acyltransferase [Xanthomonadales bacterium]MCC6560345.1 acyltransferase [Xanthomonadales bacterium]
MSSPSRDYPALDLVRAFAAFSIVVLHVVAMSQWESFPHSGPLAWFRVGFLSVDLFFVLSGFVITLTALREQAIGGNARGRFLLRRVARLAPAYFVSSLAWLALNDFAVLKQPDAWVQALTHLSFTYNFLPSTFSAINGATWTIGIEMQLYVLVALLMPLLGRWRAARLGVCVLLLALLYRLGSQYLQSGLMGLAPADSQLWFFSVQVPGMLDVFGVGAALALAVHRAELRPRSPAVWLLSLFLLLAWSASLVSALLADGEFYWHSYFWVSGFRTLVAGTVLGWLWLALVVPAAWLAHLGAWLRYPGVISYGVFLWHVPVAQWLLAHTSLRQWPLLWACIGVTGAVAAISWHVMEKPIQAWARRRGKRLRDDVGERVRGA